MGWELSSHEQCMIRPLLASAELLLAGLRWTGNGVALAWASLG
jgi:hypothetical protein